MRWPSTSIVFRAASIVLGRDHAAGTSERRSATDDDEKSGRCARGQGCATMAIAVSTTVSGAAAVVADPHRAGPRGKRRDKEVEVKAKQQRAGQSDGRCESGHRRAGLAARSSPADRSSRRSLVGNGDSAQRDASERQGDALRQWTGGS